MKSDKKMREAYLNIRRRRGNKKAITAIARKLVAYAYVMLKGNLTYGALAKIMGKGAPGNENISVGVSVKNGLKARIVDYRPLEVGDVGKR